MKLLLTGHAPSIYLAKGGRGSGQFGTWKSQLAATIKSNNTLACAFLCDSQECLIKQNYRIMKWSEIIPEKYLLENLSICNTDFPNLKKLLNMNTGIALTHKSS